MPVRRLIWLSGPMVLYALAAPLQVVDMGGSELVRAGSRPRG
jgi:hypothetical protein